MVKFFLNLIESFVRKMIIFRDIKKSMAFCGIHSPQCFDKFHRFNLRNLMIFIFLIVSAILMSLFIVCENGTLAEYSSAFYGTLSSVTTAFLFFTFIWKTKDLYKLMNNFEELIQEREYLNFDQKK